MHHIRHTLLKHTAERKRQKESEREEELVKALIQMPKKAAWSLH